MAIEATSPGLTAGGLASTDAPEQSILVACLLCMSGGFLDSYTWLSLGGVFANSQTGNVVLLGMNLALGNWQGAAHHLPPVLAFLAGAWVATRLNAPLVCLAGEIASLATVMLLLLLHRLPSPLAVVGMSFGVALQTATFRQVEQWRYLSVTVTGNLLRAVSPLASNDREAVRGAKTMLATCLMFLLGAVLGGFVTSRLAEVSLFVPLGILMFVFWVCCRPRFCRPGT